MIAIQPRFAARAGALAVATLLAGCQIPNLIRREPAGHQLSLHAAVTTDQIIVEWNALDDVDSRVVLTPIRVHPGGALEVGAPRQAFGGRAVAARDEFDEGTWRFRLSVVGTDGELLAQELSNPLRIDSDFPELRFLRSQDLGLTETFDVPTLLTIPAWGVLREGGGYDTVQLEHARRELELVLRAAVECSLGETYQADADEVRQVESARDALAPRGGIASNLTHALGAKSLLVFDLRMPESTGTVASQLVIRVYDLTYRSYHQELLKLLNTRPLVYEDYVELDYDLAFDADNSGVLLDAYGRIANRMFADTLFRRYFESLAEADDSIFVDESRQDDLLRSLGRKLADVQRDEGRAANHRRIERDFLFTRRAAPRPVEPSPDPAPVTEPPDAEPPPTHKPLFADPFPELPAEPAPEVESAPLEQPVELEPLPDPEPDPEATGTGGESPVGPEGPQGHEGPEGPEGVDPLPATEAGEGPTPGTDPNQPPVRTERESPSA